MVGVFKNGISFFITALCFICIYYVHLFLIHGKEDTFIIASFGASGVLAFSENTTKHSFFKMFASSLIGAFLGVFSNQLEINMMLKIAMAISLCVFVMNLLKISYPPAGAISIIPMLSNIEIQNLGYLYLIYPTTTGLLIVYSFSILKNQINKMYYGK